MTSKTRTERRFIARYSIRFGRKDLNKVGFSIDLSSTGVGIASKKGYKVDSIIRIELKTPNENFLLTGQVRWVKVGTLPGANEMGYEMGISLKTDPGAISNSSMSSSTSKSSKLSPNSMGSPSASPTRPMHSSTANI